MFTTGTEWTTAVTDLFNGLVTLIPLLWCLRQKPSTLRYILWAAAFGMLALMSISGFFIHGFAMSRALNDALWCVMYLLLMLMLSVYVIAIKYDIDGERGLRLFSRVNIAMAVIVSVLLGIMNYRFPDYSFVLFSIYGFGNLIYCIVRLVGQLRRRPGFRWYLAGIFIFIIGSILQSIKAIQFTIAGWPFNYNAVYHFMTLLFMFVQFKGVRVLGNEKAGGASL